MCIENTWYILNAMRNEEFTFGINLYKLFEKKNCEFRLKSSKIKKS